MGNFLMALTYFEEYNRLEKELYAAYPENVSFKNGLAISFEKLGETYTALGNLRAKQRRQAGLVRRINQDHLRLRQAALGP